MARALISVSQDGFTYLTLNGATSRYSDTGQAMTYLGDYARETATQVPVTIDDGNQEVDVVLDETGTSLPQLPHHRLPLPRKNLPPLPPHPIASDGNRSTDESTTTSATDGDPADAQSERHQQGKTDAEAGNGDDLSPGHSVLRTCRTQRSDSQAHPSAQARTAAQELTTQSPPTTEEDHRSRTRAHRHRDPDDRGVRHSEHRACRLFRTHRRRSSRNSRSIPRPNSPWTRPRTSFPASTTRRRGRPRSPRRLGHGLRSWCPRRRRREARSPRLCDRQDPVLGKDQRSPDLRRRHDHRRQARPAVAGRRHRRSAHGR